MISILSKAATWFREQPFGEAFSCVFSSPPCSAQLIWTAVDDNANVLCQYSTDVGEDEHRAFCLADVLPCVAEQDGLLSVTASGPRGISAILLTADPLGRLWTTVPHNTFDNEKIVFVTSTVHSGDLKTEGGGTTGLEGADNICNARAAEAKLPGTYTAWLSDMTKDAKDRVTQATVPYVLTTGGQVADDFADLLDCTPTCLDSPISYDETKQKIQGVVVVWTGTTELGVARFPFENCFNWEDDGADQLPTDQNLTGGTGQVDVEFVSWTQGFSLSCNRSFHLYCFQD